MADYDFDFAEGTKPACPGDYWTTISPFCAPSMHQPTKPVFTIYPGC
ncbi:hypothetical protein [Corynebacterium sp.]|nr:hypothetical protein [Corynebacterium sp.]MDO5077281.1 hypothetical protein [Corynebacterium sp.]